MSGGLVASSNAVAGTAAFAVHPSQSCSHSSSSATCVRQTSHSRPATEEARVVHQLRLRPIIPSRCQWSCATFACIAADTAATAALVSRELLQPSQPSQLLQLSIVIGLRVADDVQQPPLSAQKSA